jgi:hypothetical protein
MAQALTVFLALALGLIAAPLEARGMGRFLGGLLARGAASAAVHSGTGGRSYAKSYSPDVLTVTQLAQCIKKAGKLDQDSDQLEASRTTLRSATSGVERSSAMVEHQRGRVDQYSKASVEAFNTLIDRHNKLVIDAKARQSSFNLVIDGHNIEVNAYNSECTKKYYADDLQDAQKLAETN